MFMEFPQYRKYSNDKGFFKILSEEEFEEIQILGSRKIKTSFKASTFVDRNLIQDMLNCEGGRWEDISEGRYQEIENKEQGTGSRE